MLKQQLLDWAVAYWCMIDSVVQGNTDTVNANEKHELISAHTFHGLPQDLF